MTKTNHSPADCDSLIQSGLAAIGRGACDGNSGIQTSAAGVMLACQVGVSVAGKRGSDTITLSTERLAALGAVIRTRGKHNTHTRDTLRALNTLLRSNLSQARGNAAVDNAAIKRIVDFAAVAASVGLTHLDYDDNRHAFCLASPFLALPLPAGATGAEIVGNKREREGPHHLDYRTTLTYEYKVDGKEKRTSARLSVANFMRVHIARVQVDKRDKTERADVPSDITSPDAALETLHSYLARVDYAPSVLTRDALLDMIEAFVAASAENRADVLRILTDADNADSTSNKSKRKAA